MSWLLASWSWSALWVFGLRFGLWWWFFLTQLEGRKGNSTEALLLSSFLAQNRVTIRKMWLAACPSHSHERVGHQAPCSLDKNCQLRELGIDILLWHFPERDSLIRIQGGGVHIPTGASPSCPVTIPAVRQGMVLSIGVKWRRSKVLYFQRKPSLGFKGNHLWVRLAPDTLKGL